MIVLDASVAVKWYFAEKNSDLAIDLLTSTTQGICAPELFAIEVSAALVRKANADKSQRDGVLTLLAAFDRVLASRLVELRPLAPSQPVAAAKMAIDLGHPLKDCIYLALAMELGCDLMTCDARFAAKAQKVWAGVRVLGE